MSAVRCGFCPGAPLAIVKVARGICAGCLARLESVRALCPNCGGHLVLDSQALAAFCCACEFTLDLSERIE